MQKYDKAIGKFWVVYNQIFGKFISIDDKDAYLSEDVGIYSLKSSKEEIWNNVKKEYNLPNKHEEAYPYGEVVFDGRKHKFVVYLCDDLYADESFQKKIIRKCGLSSYTMFKKF